MIPCRFAFLFKERQGSMLNEKRSITPKKAVDILREHGTIVTIEEAKLILDFMYKFAILSVDQVVKHTKHEANGN